MQVEKTRKMVFLEFKILDPNFFLVIKGDKKLVNQAIDHLL
jgi:hypothetical protein